MKIDFETENVPTFRDCVRLSAKTFAGLAALLGLSFLAEQAVAVFGKQLWNFPLVIVIFFILLVGFVIMSNLHIHKEIHQAMMPAVSAWWICHRQKPSIAIIADLLVILFGIVPSLAIALLIFNWPPIPHLVCIGIMLNLLIICPKKN